MDKKRKSIVISCVIISVVLGFIIYWNATEDTRNMNKQIKKIQYELSEYRNKEDDYLSLYLNEEVANMEEFKEFIKGQVKEMFANKEYGLLPTFLYQFEDDDLNYDYLKNIVSDEFTKIDNLEDALKLKDEMSYLKFYNTECVILMDSPMIKKFVAEHGEKEVFVKPGTGYYANYKDSNNHRTIGIAGSPLNENESIKYYGDFKVVRDYGTRLNSYYEETSYNTYYCYFRNKSIGFSPEGGIFIYSGDYLMRFSSTTKELEGFEII